MSVTSYHEAACQTGTCRDAELDIAARERIVGDGIKVRRLLPVAARRMVGPFIFFDHMGPMHLDAGRGMDVAPHPHINLATVTYLFTGEILHRDSLGTEQLITPGAVNLMTAGRGIAHSERSPADARKSGPTLHGLQLWLALPDDQEEISPTFQHCSAADIPTVGAGGARLRLLAGSAYGLTSPVAVCSELFYADAVMDDGTTLDIPSTYNERAMYVVEGTVVTGGVRYTAGNMAVFRTGAQPVLAAQGKARIVLIGGAPLGKRYIWWNFVSSRQERIEEAKRAWLDGAFAPVVGDSGKPLTLPED